MTKVSSPKLQQQMGRHTDKAENQYTLQYFKQQMSTLKIPRFYLTIEINSISYTGFNMFLKLFKTNNCQAIIGNLYGKNDYFFST